MYFLLGYFAINSVALIVSAVAYVLSRYDTAESDKENAKGAALIFVRAIYFLSVAALIAGLALAAFNY